MTDPIKFATARPAPNGEGLDSVDVVTADGKHGWFPVPRGAGPEIAARLLRPTDAPAVRPMGIDLGPLLTRLVEAVTRLAEDGINSTPCPTTEQRARDEEHWQRNTESHAMYMRNAAEQITRRDWLAGQALAGILAHGCASVDAATLAYVIADDALEVRDREDGR